MMKLFVGERKYSRKKHNFNNLTDKTILRYYANSRRNVDSVK